MIPTFSAVTVVAAKNGDDSVTLTWGPRGLTIPAGSVASMGAALASPLAVLAVQIGLRLAEASIDTEDTDAVVAAINSGPFQIPTDY